MKERPIIQNTKEFLSNHQSEIGGAVTIGSVFYMQALNNALGINNDINPATTTEILLIAATASFFGAAIRMRQKPSDFISDIYHFVRPFKKDQEE